MWAKTPEARQCEAATIFWHQNLSNSFFNNNLWSVYYCATYSWSRTVLTVCLHRTTSVFNENFSLSLTVVINTWNSGSIEATVWISIINRSCIISKQKIPDIVRAHFGGTIDSSETKKYSCEALPQRRRLTNCYDWHLKCDNY